MRAYFWFSQTQRQFPPAGVLGALRVALTILDEASGTAITEGADATGSVCDSSNGQDMVTFETALGRTVRSAVSAPNLTWEMAARVLERPFRWEKHPLKRRGPSLPFDSSLLLVSLFTGVVDQAVRLNNLVSVSQVVHLHQLGACLWGKPSNSHD